MTLFLLGVAVGGAVFGAIGYGAAVALPRADGRCACREARS
jgi:hypothetical protein